MFVILYIESKSENIKFWPQKTFKVNMGFFSEHIKDRKANEFSNKPFFQNIRNKHNKAVK